MAFPPVPPLDGQPPTPASVQAGPPKASKGGFSALTPSKDVNVDTSGSLQVIQMALQTAAAAEKADMLIGQLLPGYAPLAAQISTMRRGGLKGALQQGVTGSTEPPNNPQLDQMGQQASMGNPAQSGVQQPPPQLPSGM